MAVLGGASKVIVKTLSNRPRSADGWGIVAAIRIAARRQHDLLDQMGGKSVLTSPWPAAISALLRWPSLAAP